MQKSLLLLSIAALSMPAVAQFNVVAPNGYSTVEGVSNNTFPWGRLTAPMRYLQVYDSTHFTNQGVTYPIVISRVRFRHNAVVPTTSWTGGTWSNVVINMSTAAVDYLAANVTFANNHGPDLTNVLTGPVSVTGGSGAGVTTPGFYYVDIPLATPFTYDPSTGSDLAFEVQLDGIGWTGTATSTDAVSGTAVTPPPLGSRVFFAGSHNSPTGSVGLDQLLVTEFSYFPTTGLYATFTANVTSGPAPLIVNFTANTFSSDPGGVTSYAWDFDGDSVIDSTLPNPSFVYTGCGDYNVSLTVTDASHAPNTMTKTAYIKTDEIAANFTYALLASPDIFQFTDTTTPAATAWDWDFNGDNVTDSTAQNPAWQLAQCQGHTVRLIATRNCRTSTKTVQVFSSPMNLATSLAAGNGNVSQTYIGNMFNIAVTNPQGINICGLAVTPYSFAGPFTMSVYVTPNTYVGNNLNAAAWRLIGTGSGTSTAGPSTNPTLVDVPLANGFAYLPPGNYGVAVYLNRSPLATVNIAYSNPPFGPFGNSDLTIHPTPATAQGLATLGLFSGSVTNNRGWNGRFYYSTASAGGNAGYGYFAPGCAGSMGVTNLTANRPQLGTTLSVNLNNLPQSLAIMITGFSNSTSLFGPLPVDLASYGAPGCFGRVSTDATLFLFGAGNTATWNFAIPNAPALSGLQLYNQALVLDPGFNTLGGVMSDAAAMLIGT